MSGSYNNAMIKRYLISIETHHSANYLETLAKILHILSYSCLHLKALIRSCLFLLATKLLKFFIVILVRVLPRVSRK